MRDQENAIKPSGYIRFSSIVPTTPHAHPIQVLKTQTDLPQVLVMNPRFASPERQAGVQRRRQYALHKDEATLVDYTGLLMKERRAHCNTARSIICDESTNAMEHQRHRDAGEAAWDRHVELLEDGTTATYADVKTEVL